MLATLLGGLALATSVAWGAAADDSPGVPTSTVSTVSGHTAHYCVSGYAPNVAVSVHNEDNDAAGSIHANNRGSGCIDIKVEVDCGKTLSQAIVAAGLGADGNPATSKAQAAVTGGPPECANGASASGRDDAASGVPGGAATLWGLVVAGVLALVGGVVMVVRRRRSVPPDGSAE